MLPFEIGTTYRRKPDIHDVYGGGRQSGISPSAEHPFIFIFSGATGESYGYDDGWQEAEKTFLYSGEGQIGDMEFTRGNRALRDHVAQHEREEARVDGRVRALVRAVGQERPRRGLELPLLVLEGGPAQQRAQRVGELVARRLAALLAHGAKVEQLRVLVARQRLEQHEVRARHVGDEQRAAEERVRPACVE